MKRIKPRFQIFRMLVSSVLAIGLVLFALPLSVNALDQKEFLKEITEFTKNKKLPPAKGPEEPRVEPVKGDDHLYHQDWFLQSFLDLKEDLEETHKAGKRFAVVFEQRGCGYCIKMHKNILAKRYIHDYVRKNFNIIQLDLWGKRKVTDFDGTELTEEKLARRWGVIYTPTILFFDDKPDFSKMKTGKDLVVARIPGGLGANTFYDMFTWVAIKGYETKAHFQRFHTLRVRQRQKL